jgi:iron-sulfur cluster assembly protein
LKARIRNLDRRESFLPDNHYQREFFFMVTLTEKAAKEIQRAMTDAKMTEGTVLRVRVVGGGCSGYNYDFRFDKAELVDTAKDFVDDQFGIPVVVDKKSDLYLDGTVIDYKDGLEQRGFKFENPNVTRSCGCGSSFAV